MKNEVARDLHSQIWIWIRVLEADTIVGWGVGVGGRSAVYGQVWPLPCRIILTT